MNNCARDAQPLLHTSRKPRDQRISLHFQPDLCNHLANTRWDCDLAHFVGVGKIVEILPDLDVVIDGKEIGQITNVLLGALRFGADVNPCDLHLALCRNKQSAHHPNSGCLAGAVWSDQAVNLSLRNRQIQVVDRYQIAELLPKSR